MKLSDLSEEDIILILNGVDNPHVIPSLMSRIRNLKFSNSDKYINMGYSPPKMKPNTYNSEFRVKNKCLRDGCNRIEQVRGYCKSHYTSALVNNKIKGTPCRIEGCDKNTYSAGMCQKHDALHKREWHNFIYPLKSDFISYRSSCKKEKRKLEVIKNRKRLTERQQFIFFAVMFGVEDSCWLWPYNSKEKNNYISPTPVDYKGKRYTPPRLALTLSKGNPPHGKNECAHDPVLCNNSLCCNPAHLRWASRAENHADMRISGTMGNGEKNGRAVLTEEQVKDILRDNRKQTEIALDYNVSSAMIHLIKTRKRWGHVQI